MTGPPREVQVVGAEEDYWRRYVSSLHPGAAAVPALAAAPALTRDVLARAGVPVVDGGDPGPGDRELAAGLAALARDGDLGRVTGLERELRAGRPAALPAPPTGAWVVGVGRAAALGLARAVADRRPYLAVDCLADDRLAELGRHAASLHVVTAVPPPAELAALGRRLAAAATHELLPGVPGCPVGYLTGRDAAAMTVLDAKQRLAPRPARTDVVVDSTLTGGPSSAAPAGDLRLVPYREVDRRTVHGDGAVRLLAITSHGMSDLVHLNDDYLCGRSRYLELGTPDPDRLPSCTMAAGGYCFFKPAGTAVLAHELPAEHVFVNSCGSLRFGETDFDPLFAIWFSVLDGRARSYAGSVRWKDGHGLEAHLYRRLLLAGHPLGAAVALVNRALPAHQLESGGEVYALLGDPEDRLVPARPAQPVAVLGPGRTAVGVRAGWAQLAVRPELAGPAAAGTLLVEAPGLVASTLPARPGAPVPVLLHGPADVDGEVEVRVRDLAGELARVREAARALHDGLDPALGLQGLYPDRVRQGGRKNLEGRLVHVARLWKERFTDPGVVPRLLRSLRSLDRELDEADAEIARWLHERVRTTSYRFSEHYQETFQLAADRPAGCCYACGDPLTARRLEHVLRPEVTRSELICRRCGGIEDRPDDAVALEVHLDPSHRRGGPVDVTVRLRSAAPTARAGYCVAAVRKSAELGIEQAEPVRPARVEPGGEVEVPFRLQLGAAVPTHQYDLQVAFVSLTRIQLGRRCFWVTA